MTTDSDQELAASPALIEYSHCDSYYVNTTSLYYYYYYN